MNKLVTIALSGLAALYALLTLIWDLPNPVLVLGVLAALTALSGLLMGNNGMGEYDGELITVGRDPDTGFPDFSLMITVDPNTLPLKDNVLLKSIDQTA